MAIFWTKAPAPGHGCSDSGPRCGNGHFLTLVALGCPEKKPRCGNGRFLAKALVPGHGEYAQMWKWPFSEFGGQLAVQTAIPRCAASWLAVWTAIPGRAKPHIWDCLDWASAREGLETVICTPRAPFKMATFEAPMFSPKTRPTSGLTVWTSPPCAKASKRRFPHHGRLLKSDFLEPRLFPRKRVWADPQRDPKTDAVHKTI